MKFSLLLVGLLLVVGCSKSTPEQRAHTEQQRQNEALDKDYQVVKLFNKDGCSVYQFYDHSNYHYFTNCSGSTSTQHSCGKNCTREEEISTEAE